MAYYPSPTNQGTLFNPEDYGLLDSQTITKQYADEHYLQFPIAQGQETFSSIKFSDNTIQTTAYTGSNAIHYSTPTTGPAFANVFIIPDTFNQPNALGVQHEILMQTYPNEDGNYLITGSCNVWNGPMQSNFENTAGITILLEFLDSANLIVGTTNLFGACQINDNYLGYYAFPPPPQENISYRNFNATIAQLLHISGGNGFSKVYGYITGGWSDGQASDFRVAVNLQVLKI